MDRGENIKNYWGKGENFFLKKKLVYTDREKENSQKKQN